MKRLQESGIDSEIYGFPTDTGTDYLISNTQGSVAVQRKVAVSELISELDQILYETIPLLKNFSDQPVLLIEENHDITQDGYLINHTTGRDTQMLATAYYSYLETIRKTGVDVITTRDLNQSIWWMISLHNYLGKNHYPHHKKYHTMHEIAVGVLTAIPTIGEVRANKALKESSIRGMVGMKTVTGLTDKQNEKLQQVLQWREKT